MSITVTAALALSGCAASPPSSSTSSQTTLDQRDARAIATDMARMLLQWLPPARTTLRLPRSFAAAADVDKAFGSELVRQLRTHGYAVWEPQGSEAPPAPIRSTPALTTTLRPLPTAAGIYCAIVRVDEVQWARCYQLAADNPRPAGPWSRTVLTTAPP